MKLNFKKRIINPLFWMLVSGILFVIFGFIHKFSGSEWSYNAVLFTLIYPIIFMVVAMVFAWIVNPIREWIEKRKNK